NLPDECSKVVWIDCDMVYARTNWAADVVRLLDDFPVIHAFRRVFHLRKDIGPDFGQRDIIHEETSFGSRLADDRAMAIEDISHNTPRHCHRVGGGFSWGAGPARRRTVRLYDACIAGGGARALGGAAGGCREAAVRALCRGSWAAAHSRRWAARAS